VSVPVGDDAPRSAQRVAGGIGLLVGLRAPLEDAPDGETRGWAQEDPFPFARTFAAAWCGVSEKAVRTGLAHLEAVGLIERAGEIKAASPRRAAILWRLTAPSAGGGRRPPTKPPEDAPPTGDDGLPDEDALVAALIEAFDAEEVPEEQPARSRPSRAADGAPPCQYERHRAHDWIGDGGRAICGICHPPAGGARRTRGGAS